MAHAPAQLGKTLADRYTIERELGRGGMAVVYLGQDRKLGRPVALKVLHPELAASIGAERFVREIEIAAKLAHPHILSLYDCGEVDGMLYYTMPYVAGESLRARIDREHQLSIEDARTIIEDVADAVGYAHAQGLIHRDIKPENVLFEAGHAVVTDFGIARAIAASRQEALTATGLAVGTPAYMSPEQATAGPDVDARTDIYSLGCLLYEMLVGEPPFSGANAQAVIARHLADPVPSISTVRPGVPEPVVATIAKALAKSPADRFGSTRAFVDALRRETPAATAGSESIAVLPFANLSPHTENEYFADGLTDELIATLSMNRALRVISRTSSNLFKRTEQGIPAIARALGVRYVVEGTVRRAGNSVRITAQLINAETDTHLWAERYSGTLDNIFDLQESLSQRIVEALEVTLTPQEAHPPGSRPAPQAYDAYLRGRSYLEQVTAAGRRRAIEYFNQAVALDPGYARAYAALAGTYLQEAMLGGEPNPDLVPRARTAAEHALELDPALGAPHAVLGWLALAQGWNWSAAEVATRRAIEAEPHDPSTLLVHSILLLGMGRLDEAMAVSRRLLKLDPLSPLVNTHHAMQYYYARAYDRALEQANRTAEMDPTYVSVRAVQGAVYLQVGRDDEAVAAYAEVMALSGTSAETIEAYRLRYRTEGIRGFWRWRAETRPSRDKAVAHAALGEIDDAFVWLTRALSENPLGLMQLNVDPAFDPLRGDPRFDALLQRMNLPWASHTCGGSP